MYEFKMSIGDWSGDGHSQCKDYNIKSNKPVEQVREAHFKITEVTGINIEEICNEYQECTMPSNIIDKLRELGFDIKACGYIDKRDDGDVVYAEPNGMVQLWCFLLMKADPGLELSIVHDVSIPTLHFYGCDSNKRHIGFVGYGCFE